MRCRSRSVLAALVTAAVASPFASLALMAQTPVQTETIDPPGTVYEAGALDEDPVVERKRAIVPRHRAFLPPSIDLSSRMPPVGNQGHSASCTAWATAY